MIFEDLIKKLDSATASITNYSSEELSAGFISDLANTISEHRDNLHYIQNADKENHYYFCIGSTMLKDAYSSNEGLARYLLESVAHAPSVGALTPFQKGRVVHKLVEDNLKMPDDITIIPDNERRKPGESSVWKQSEYYLVEKTASAVITQINHLKKEIADAYEIEGCEEKFKLRVEHEKKFHVTMHDLSDIEGSLYTNINKAFAPLVKLLADSKGITLIPILSATIDIFFSIMIPCPDGQTLTRYWCVDLKTMSRVNSSSTKTSIEKSFIDYKYYLQSSHYMNVVRLHYRLQLENVHSDSFLFLFVLPPIKLLTTLLPPQVADLTVDFSDMSSEFDSELFSGNMCSDLLGMDFTNYGDREILSDFQTAYNLAGLAFLTGFLALCQNSLFNIIKAEISNKRKIQYHALDSIDLIKDNLYY